MDGSKRAIVVGIPGVGKTTVINKAAEMLNKRDITAKVVVFGTVMFEEAQKRGIKHRDELRKMPVEEQRKLQDIAAHRIADMTDKVVMIDTHLFISTKEGYYPGLPVSLLNTLKPTNFVMIGADPKEILVRRLSDKTRNRDIITESDIKDELEISQIMVASCSILTGAPFTIVMNHDGKVDEAAEQIVNALGDKIG
ncbi:MAG: adenylate kinase [Nitrososphaerales archaeon]